MNLDDGAVTKLTEDYDNFPRWSPRRDLIMFFRLLDGAYRDLHDHAGWKASQAIDIHSVATTRTGRGRQTASGSPLPARMGFKDEALNTDSPQPYGEIFVMRYDGTHVEQLTDNQWEEGTPAWQRAKF